MELVRSVRLSSAGCSSVTADEFQFGFLADDFQRVETGGVVFGSQLQSVPGTYLL